MLFVIIRRMCVSNSESLPAPVPSFVPDYCTTISGRCQAHDFTKPKSASCRDTACRVRKKTGLLFICSYHLENDICSMQRSNIGAEKIWTRHAVSLHDVQNTSPAALSWSSLTGTRIPNRFVFPQRYHFLGGSGRRIRPCRLQQAYSQPRPLAGSRVSGSCSG